MGRREREEALRLTRAQLETLVPIAGGALSGAAMQLCAELGERPLLAAGISDQTDVAELQGLFVLTSQELLICSPTGRAHGYDAGRLRLDMTPGKIRVATPSGVTLTLHSSDDETLRKLLIGQGAVPDSPQTDQVTQRNLGVQVRRRLSDDLSCVLVGTVLGGAGDCGDLWIGARVVVCFRASDFVVLAHGVQYGPVIGYDELDVLEANGPGAVATGGGFAGGGFGAEGALVGMAAAGILNALTSSTTTRTILHLASTTRELFILHEDLPPEAVEIELSPARLQIRTKV